MALSGGVETILYAVIFLRVNLLCFRDAKKDLKGTKQLHTHKKT